MAKLNSQHVLAQELLDVQLTLGWMDLVIGSIDDAVCVTDTSGCLLFVNEYFSQLVGTPRILLLGSHMEAVLALQEVPNPLEEYLHARPSVLGGGTYTIGIFDWQAPQGNNITFRVINRSLPTSEQSVYLIQDITREYELTRMKNDFINLASHQLRTPMSAIMLYSHMLSEGFAGPLNKEQQAYADTLIHTSERMIRLINDLLNIASLRSSPKGMSKQPIKLADTITKIVTELTSKLQEKQLNQHVFIAKDLPIIHSDATAVYEILSNLITNAVQYTKAGGTVRVSARAQKDSVSITVKDSGIGIPSDAQARIYNQFSRADNALVEYPAGTGLGLYLVKILVDTIGASISFKSKLNKGTTFIVTIPSAATPH